MDKWIWIEIIGLIGSLFIALFWMQTKGWRVGFPFSASNALLFALVLMAPLTFALFSFVMGWVYFGLTEHPAKSHLLMFFGVPLVIFLTIGTRGFYLDWKQKREHDKVIEARKIILNWAEKQPFWKENECNFHVYLRNESPSGRINLVVSPEQVPQVEEAKKELPGWVYLNTMVK